MARDVTLFPRYAQRENRTTNYCLLVLKMLYEENPKLLGEALSSLLGEDIGDKVGVTFRQQERRGAGIPDGLITQLPIAIYIETKNFDWFHSDQLERHLASLDQETAGTKVLLALSNFEADDNRRFSHLRELCAGRYRNSIAFKAASFQDFLDAIHIDHLPKNIADTLIEFRAYLDGEDLLPTWESLLDIVNCAGRPEDILAEDVYICPATGGAYNHSRCKYFGMYRRKRVERVALIKAIVDVEDADQAVVKWKNVTEAEESLLDVAKDKVRRLRPDDYPKRVFLLGPGYETDFIKDTPGGMQTSKRYFSVDSLRTRNAEELARALRGMTWSSLKESSAF